MNRFLTCFFAVCITIASGSDAAIFETQRITSVAEHIDADTLILFDIDNTVMTPAQELGSDQWFHHRIDVYVSAGMESREALEKALAEWMSVQNVTQVQLVEPEAQAFIAQLQEQGFTVMGFTTRGLGLSTRTIQQLQSLGVDFCHTAPANRDVFFDNGRGVLFRHGILFTAGTNKGTALEKFLAAIDMKPKSVLFINDKLDHLQPVEQYCQSSGIPFTGLRYGYLDQKVAGFRRDIAAVQFHHFGHILSDDQAESVVREISEAVNGGDQLWQAQ